MAERNLFKPEELREVAAQCDVLLEAGTRVIKSNGTTFLIGSLYTSTGEALKATLEYYQKHPLALRLTAGCVRVLENGYRVVPQYGFQLEIDRYGDLTLLPPPTEHITIKDFGPIFITTGSLQEAGSVFRSTTKGSTQNLDKEDVERLSTISITIEHIHRNLTPKKHTAWHLFRQVIDQLRATTR